MTLDLNNTLANALLDQYDTHFPAGSIVDIRSGAPAGAENAAGGTLLDSITLPATPWNAASGGSKTKNGTWSANATATGTAGNYRLRNAAATKLEEGTVGTSAADVIIDNTSITSGQPVTVTVYTRSL